MGAGAAYAGWRKTAQTWRSGAASTAGPEGTTFPGPPAGPCERRTPHTASPADQPNQLVPADTPTRTRPTPRSSGRPHASHVPAHIPPGAGTSQSRASAPTPPGRRSPASSRPGRDGDTGLPWYDGGSPPPWRSRACDSRRGDTPAGSRVPRPRVRNGISAPCGPNPRALSRALRAERPTVRSLRGGWRLGTDPCAVSPCGSGPAVGRWGAVRRRSRNGTAAKTAKGGPPRT